VLNKSAKKKKKKPRKINELEKKKKAQYCFKGTGENDQREFLNILQGKYNLILRYRNRNLNYGA